MKRRHRPVTIACAVHVIAFGVMLRDAHAQDKATCAHASEEAQDARRDGKLLDAKKKLLLCAAASCPAVVRTDIPSIVAMARDAAGRDLEGVMLSIDDQRVPLPLDGRAVELDPGWRVVRFERSGFVPARERVLVRQGEKNRTIVVALTPVDHAPAPAPPERAGPEAGGQPSRPLWPFVLAGAGVAMAGAGVILAVSGHGDAAQLQRECAPACGESAASAALTKWIVGWALIGVGATAGGIGTWFAFQPTGVQVQGSF